MRVHFYEADTEKDEPHLGCWYTEDGQYPQVPRVGDTVWLETDAEKLTRFVCKEVHWSFKNRRMFTGETPHPSVGAEVYVERAKPNPVDTTAVPK